MKRLTDTSRATNVPSLDPSELANESDVEQKVIYPLFTHASLLNIAPGWIKTKFYLPPAAIGKGARRQSRYIPDYGVIVDGFPLVICEAKNTDVSVEHALEEARLYSIEVNKHFPKDINPISHVCACNGLEFIISYWDNVTDAKTFTIESLLPASLEIQTLIELIGPDRLRESAAELSKRYSRRYFFSVNRFMGEPTRQVAQLGINDFGRVLLPYLDHYFNPDSIEQEKEIIKYAYVTSNEVTNYGSTLEMYLKNRTRIPGASDVEKIVTGKSTASGISEEVSRFTQNPSFFGKVQLIIGSVGAGKSTFVRRFYETLLSARIKEKTMWSFLDFNFMPSDESNVRKWVAEKFIDSFATLNGIDIYDYDLIEKILNKEIKQFERGTARLYKEKDPAAYAREMAAHIDKYAKDPIKLSECLARAFSGERGFGIVAVFDNVDRRDRDDQLRVFEAAQWFKNLTRSLVIVNLRDSTFEAHKDQPPLDAFVNAVNFYISPPRFAHVIRKRLELVLDRIPTDAATRLEFDTEKGARVSYSESDIRGYLLNIYNAIFEKRGVKNAAAIEMLMARNVRRALAMFRDLIISPHMLPSEMAATMLDSRVTSIQPYQIVRALMRTRYRYYHGKSGYVQNVLTANVHHNRPSNFLKSDILEFLIKYRREKVDFSVEGYCFVETVVKHLTSIGYDESDGLDAIRKLVEAELIEPESLIVSEIELSEPVRVNAAGYIHMRFFVNEPEYIIGITPDCAFANERLTRDVANIWASGARFSDINLSKKIAILQKLAEYVEEEYHRRVQRHAFYKSKGYGGAVVLKAMARARGSVEKVSEAWKA